MKLLIVGICNEMNSETEWLIHKLINSTFDYK